MADGVPERLQEQVPADLDQGSEAVPADADAPLEEAVDEASTELEEASKDDEDLGPGDEPAGGEG